MLHSLERVLGVARKGRLEDGLPEAFALGREPVGGPAEILELRRESWCLVGVVERIADRGCLRSCAGCCLPHVTLRVIEAFRCSFHACRAD